MAIPFENINLPDYTYKLPENRIASFPAPNRDDSLLLIQKADGSISHDQFRHLASYLEENSHLVFNNSRVIPARLIFMSPSGSKIELFCLSPVSPVTYDKALSTTSASEWNCMAGNLKRFRREALQMEVKNGQGTIKLIAEKIRQSGNLVSIRFSWDHDSLTFAHILSVAGRTPLPPYIKREPEEIDRERYQTIYSKHEGSVAAPTAGLHFTADIFGQLDHRQISIHEVTLHVGAGTFQPIRTHSLSDHEMHAEILHVSKQFIHTMACLGKPVGAVGTTSVRTLETLYWLGVKLLTLKKPIPDDLRLDQWEAYELPQEIPMQEAFDALDQWLGQNHLAELFTTTRLMIIPGYRFRVVNTLITNFHQPGSTLLLLVAAFIGKSWKTAYQYALDNGFRFLSYGDCSVLFGK